MAGATDIKAKYVVDEEGHKTAVVINLKDYESLMESVEDLEDANDLLKAEREANGFIPYDEFRKKWLKS
ncbi:MAG: hypothetical protein V3W31_02910 [Thermodesulfobacteriota bacterium]